MNPFAIHFETQCIKYKIMILIQGISIDENDITISFECEILKKSLLSSFKEKKPIFVFSTFGQNLNLNAKCKLFFFSF